MKGFGDKKKSKKKILNEFQIKQYHNQIMLRAFKYHSEGNISEAKKSYQYLIKEGFKDIRVFNNYGMILLNSGDLRQARIFISKVIELNPKDEVAYSNLGGILKELGELKDAELLIRKAIELNPKNSTAYSNLGGILQDLGELKEAEIFTRKAIELNPYFATAYLNLGIIFKKSDKLTEAEIYTRKAIELNPKISEAHSNLGGILRDLGKLKEAEICTRKAIELNPNSATAYLNLGIIFKKSDKLSEAEIYTRKAIELNPKISEAHSNLGGILRDLGKLKEAEIYTRKAIELNPNFANAYLNLGRILYDLGKLKESELILLKAIELNPDLAAAYYSLSNIGELNNQKKWIDYLFTEDLLERQDDINKIDIYFARANILERKSNYIQSANMLRKANNLNRKLYGSNYIKIKNLMKNYYQIWQGIKANKELQENPLTSIFIVGLPRSGKTITESILACNKSVLQCGEDKALSIAVNKYLNPKENHNNQDLYQIYIANITKEISGKSFICSTIPNNFIYTGLIATQIPNSKIIFCFRNPLDNIKEMYSAHFGEKFTFTTSIVESAKFLLSINELMEEYKKIFSSKIFFLNYDELILNPEQELKSLLSWLGWEYEQKYLHPKLDPTTYMRSDKQNSLLNKKHQNIWKHYKELLKPAIEVFKESSKYKHFIS